MCARGVWGGAAWPGWCRARRAALTQVCARRVGWRRRCRRGVSLCRARRRRHGQCASGPSSTCERSARTCGVGVCILHQPNGPPPASCRKHQQRGRLGTSGWRQSVTRLQAASGGTGVSRHTMPQGLPLSPTRAQEIAQILPHAHATAARCLGLDRCRRGRHVHALRARTDLRPATCPLTDFNVQHDDDDDDD